MKKYITLLLLFIIIITTIGCENKNTKDVTIKNFVNSYSSNYPGDKYYKKNDLDYFSLFDIQIEDAEFTDSDDLKVYKFVLLESLIRDTATMYITTDGQNAITSIIICLTDTSYNLFYTDEDIKDYLYKVIMSILPNLSKKEVLNITSELLLNNTVSKNNYKFQVHIDLSGIIFTITNTKNK